MGKCGDCYFWMKSRDCPREKNINGQTCGPSMGAAACDKFVNDKAVRRRNLAREAVVSLSFYRGVRP